MRRALVIDSVAATRAFWWLGNILLIVGLLMLAVFAVARIKSKLISREEVRRFQGQAASQVSPRHLRQPEPSFAFWSEQRIAKYQQSLDQSLTAPIALLRIPKVNLEVAVLEGTGEAVLNRGVGHIPGTALPGAKTGNIGIAGHRDGFFRVLEDVAPGNIIELETIDGSETYRVDRAIIVEPTDVAVLRSTGTPQLTLVTCYPFRFIGSAPERYVVKASLLRVPMKSSPISESTSGPFDISATRSEAHQ